MSQELSRNLRCVLLRSGIKIWIEQEKEAPLKKMIEQGVKFIEYEGQYINTADITGIFTPEKMADLTREKNGEWICKFGKWHQRATKCDCEHEAWLEKEARKTEKLLKERQSGDVQGRTDRCRIKVTLMTNSPIEKIINASVVCLKCGAKSGECDCWENCPCGWSKETGGQCSNTIHSQVEPQS